MKRFLLVAVALMLAACTAPDSARNALESQGFTDIQIQGYAFFGCGKDDSFHTKFTAKNAQGRPVEGVVCSGLFKGSTVRF
jgi:hypothetical protein